MSRWRSRPTGAPDQAPAWLLWARATAQTPPRIARAEGRKARWPGTVAHCAAGMEELHLHAVVVRCEPDPSGPGSWNLALFFVETESTPLERLSRYLHEHHDSHHP